MPKPSALQRFHSKYTVNPVTGCWDWHGSSIPQRANNGFRYGMFYANGKLGYAHRFSYELAKGPMPEGLVTDHLCRNTLCVNADHLEAVTQGENNKRRNPAFRKTHCPRGHAYTAENTHLTKQGKRQCRACWRKHKPLQRLTKDVIAQYKEVLANA